VPFRVYLTGIDSSGQGVERLLSQVFEPQTVKVDSVQMLDMYPGQTLTHIFSVTNFGTADTFRLTVGDDQGYVTQISPTTISLATNETQEIKVPLAVPTAALVNTLDSVVVTAQSINSPGITNSASLEPFRIIPVPTLRLNNVTATAFGGNGDAVIDPGEGGLLSVTLLNSGSTNATNVQATLITSTPGVIVASDSSSYPNLLPSNASSNSAPFVFYLPSSAPCGLPIDFALIVNADFGDGSDPSVYNFTVLTGHGSSSLSTVSYAGPPVPIPDGQSSGVDIPLVVSGNGGTITDLDFRFDGTSCTTAPGATTVGLDHTYVSDLVITLTSPRGTTITLVNSVGGSSNNFCQTVLDDEGGGRAIQSTNSDDAPFTGTFTPAEPLATFRGEPADGTWTLHVTDNFSSDVGNVRAFSLIIASVQYSCNVSPPDVTPPSCAMTAYHPDFPASIDLTVQDTGLGLASVKVIEANNVTVTIPAFDVGTTSQLVVNAALSNPVIDGSVALETTDIAGNVTTCNHSVTTAQNIVGAGSTVLSESCAPSNGMIDPGEGVSVNLSLTNTGTGTISNLVATLQPSALIIAPSGPAVFGTLAPGATVGKDFSFTASGPLVAGQTLTLTLALQDGTSNLGTISNNFTIGDLTNCGFVQLIARPTLTRADSSTVIASIGIQNLGAVGATNVQLNFAALNGTWGSPLPQNLGDISPGGTIAVDVSFSNSTPGASAMFRSGGTYGEGTFVTTIWSLTIP